MTRAIDMLEANQRSIGLDPGRENQRTDSVGRCVCRQPRRLCLHRRAHSALRLKDCGNILYSEVAPVCFWNLETPVPPVWTGFEDDSLLSEIDQALNARAASRVSRAVDKLKVAWLRYSYGYIWKEILKHV